MSNTKKTWKVIKTWYVEAKTRLEASQKAKRIDKGLNSKPDETRISEVRDW